MEKLNNQINYWDQIGSTKTFGHPVNFDRLKKLLPTNSRILDFGCGYGRVSASLYESGYTDVLGVDSSSTMVTSARKRYPELSFKVLENSPEIPSEGNTFDAVFLFTVLTCIPTDQGQRAVILEINRVLKPCGLLYVSDLLLQTNERNKKRYERDYTKYGIYGIFDLPDGVTFRHHDRKYIEYLFSDFTLLALDEIEILTMNKNLARGFQWFGRK